VRSGLVGAIGEAGQWLAQSQGYFVQEGLAVDLSKSDPAGLFPALLSGDVDVIGGPLDPGLMSAIQRGVDFRIVATQASNEPGGNGAFLVVRKDLIDSGRVRTEADLKGLKIAIPAHQEEYVMSKVMQAGGLTLGDADLVLLSFPAAVTALGTGAIDVGMLAEPLASVAVKNGFGVKWKSYGDIVPGIQTTVVIFSPRFAAQRDLATRWMTAYIRGIRAYNDAFVKNINRPQTVEALAGIFSIDPRLFDVMGYPHLDADGKVNMQSMVERMQWYVQAGYLSAPIDLARVVDMSFAEAAVARLGQYR
jgi:NitT/TauT family transport system substrate-binding protein